MRRSRKKMLLKVTMGICVSAAVIGAAVWFGYTRISGLKERIGELTGLIEEQRLNMCETVCFARDMAPGDVIAYEDLMAVSVPADLVPADCIRTASAAEGGMVRIPVLAGTYVTPGMLVPGAPSDDERVMRYGSILVDPSVVPGDCVDVRLRYADGTDYVVMSGKTVYAIDDNGVLLRVGERELLMMDSAITDTELNFGSYLYAAAYVEGTLQDPAAVNYVPVPEVSDLLRKDPNVDKIHE